MKQAVPYLCPKPSNSIRLLILHERAGRNHHRRIRVSLVGTTDERAGDLHGQRDTRNLRGGLTQLTTNKVSIPERNLLDRNFVFKNFATQEYSKFP